MYNQRFWVFYVCITLALMIGVGSVGYTVGKRTQNVLPSQKVEQMITKPSVSESSQINSPIFTSHTGTFQGYIRKQEDTLIEVENETGVKEIFEVGKPPEFNIYQKTERKMLGTPDYIKEIELNRKAIITVKFEEGYNRVITIAYP